MRKKVDRVFFDEYGAMHEGWLLAGFVAAIVAFVTMIIIVFAIAIGIANGVGCNQIGDAYSVDTEYKFWADQCFITLDDGSVVSEDSFRAIGVKEGWID